MSRHALRLRLLPALLLFLTLAATAQTKPAPAPPAPAPPAAAPPAPTHADILRGAYGPYRANNDLLYYHLDIRVDPDKQTITGKNTIRFRMLQDGSRVQIDLSDALHVDKILLGTAELKYQRDSGAVFIDFPRTLRAGQTYSIDFYYSGHPLTIGRFGGMVFAKDPAGHPPAVHPWIYTSCEDDGASIWWPNKDQWRDEVESMDISVAVPNGLTDVSNGKFKGSTDLGDGYTRWDWHVSYPINAYDVALNIGDYVHFSDHYGTLRLDYYVLPADLDKAKVQFTQVKGMLEAFTHYFGPYPFERDGYKLVQVPYSGMEHQTAVAYGNLFKNGYLGRDWTGVGISPKFDFIIIHESAHEWFGNSITAQDRSDMWIHEAWATYLESLYVEYWYGKDAAIRYLNGYKSKVKNRSPHHHRTRHQRHPSRRPVLQGRAYAQHPAQRHRQRPALVPAHPRLLPALQISEHHDRRRRHLVQPANRSEPDARSSTSTCATPPSRSSSSSSTPPPEPSPIAGKPTRPTSPCPCALATPPTGRPFTPPPSGKP